MDAITTFQIHVNIDSHERLYDYVSCQEILRNGGRAWDRDELWDWYGSTGHLDLDDQEAMSRIRRMDAAINETGIREGKENEGIDEVIRCVSETDDGQLPRRLLPVYRAGEIVEGVVAVTFKEDVKADALTVSLLGRSFVRVMYPQGIYKGEDTYTDETITLMEGPFVPGKHRFPFKFTLPADAPQSVAPLLNHTSNNFTLIYRLVARIERVGFFGTQSLSTHQGIWVASDYDAGSDPVNRGPVEAVQTMQTGFFDRGGEIILRAMTPTRGVVRGESVPLTIEIENNSSSVIQQLTACIILSGGATLTRKSQTVLPIHVEGEAVKAGPFCPGSKMFKWRVPWQFNRCQVDSNRLPVGEFTNMRLIRVQYQVRVRAVRWCLANNLEVMLPIVVGTENLWECSPKDADKEVVVLQKGGGGEQQSDEPLTTPENDKPPEELPEDETDESEKDSQPNESQGDEKSDESQVDEKSDSSAVSADKKPDNLQQDHQPDAPEKDDKSEIKQKPSGVKD